MRLCLINNANTSMIDWGDRRWMTPTSNRRRILHSWKDPILKSDSPSHSRICTQASKLSAQFLRKLCALIAWDQALRTSTMLYDAQTVKARVEQPKECTLVGDTTTWWLKLAQDVVGRARSSVENAQLVREIASYPEMKILILPLCLVCLMESW